MTKRLLFINPKNKPSSEPVMDELTARVMYAWEIAVPRGRAYKGWHTCSCGAKSASTNFTLYTREGTEIITNSLCVHYISHHRDEVSEDNLKLIKTLPWPCNKVGIGMECLEAYCEYPFFEAACSDSEPPFLCNTSTEILEQHADKYGPKIGSRPTKLTFTKEIIWNEV